MASRFSLRFHLPRLSLLTSSSRPPQNAPINFSTFCTISECPVTPAKRKTFSHIFQDCSIQKAISSGKEAHAQMIVSGFTPTVFVENCLMQMYVKCSNLDYARKVFDGMPQRDTVSWNALVFGYAGHGAMRAADALFRLMPERDIISWNCLISGFAQNEDCVKSIGVFKEMRQVGTGFDHSTLSIILKVSSLLEDLGLGVQVHVLAIRTGFHDNVVTASALVDMYGKCKQLESSLRLFQEMPERNLVSWSALIACYVQNDQLIKAIDIFKEMQRAGVGVSQSTYASVLRSSAGLTALRLGSQFHGHALKSNFGDDVIVATATLDMYGKCERLDDAQKLFKMMPRPSLQSYNAIIIGYSQSDKGSEALLLFRLLQRSGLGFDEISLSGALSACGVFKGLIEGLQVHTLTIKSTFRSSICVKNAILDMYGKCGALREACLVFDEMERRDAVSWNAIIAAHEQNEDGERTLELFASMVHSGMEPDEFTYGSVLKACGGLQALSCGVEIHNRIIKLGTGLDMFVGTALIDMYSKCGIVEEAEKIHNRLEQQTTISWNAIISGLALQNQSEEAHRYFSWMLENNAEPDSFTYATILDTCANLATISLGKQIHARILKLKLQEDVYICSTLVDMYSKCGNLNDSHLMFEKAPNRDFVTWNAMICGYSQHGLGEQALQVFERMQHHNVKPNHATFVSVLRACAHMGLPEKGLEYFEMMLGEYKLDPQLEHYCCMVDILGRSGRVNEALKLICQMPIEADAVIWRTLLSTCTTHGSVEVAEKAASYILQLEPEDSSTYVLLSNIYANAGMWEEVSKMRKAMRSNKLRKEPGCSWIQVKDEVHMFLVGDRAHPSCEEIYEKLNLLIAETKGSGNMIDSECPFNEETREDACEQQEDLTLSFAL
ncbi:pentatricopeptide repeat-containing protein At3g02330, mitochondrial [Punica granatum]|uniref:Uncharacterized protein n=2 Tax=Punica granatum TaxID=22663 RepID=A0A218VV96_PUNGR|nr:pentatricopeptide repeat-containing protein At3g02330, mitochondrial [Punica granatum]OWM64474.1 hypothetical protein CDL15_Pgr020441 [Punica granatum]PKI75568.1 hypothetical protein CRG98_003969 [Punica granatum]